MILCCRNNTAVLPAAHRSPPSPAASSASRRLTTKGEDDDGDESCSTKSTIPSEGTSRGGSYASSAARPGPPSPPPGPPAGGRYFVLAPSPFRARASADGAGSAPSVASMLSLKRADPIYDSDSEDEDEYYRRHIPSKRIRRGEVDGAGEEEAAFKSCDPGDTREDCRRDARIASTFASTFDLDSGGAFFLPESMWKTGANSSFHDADTDSDDDDDDDDYAPSLFLSDRARLGGDSGAGFAIMRSSGASSVD